MKIFFYGIRFDWFSIVLINSLFILLHLIPGFYKNNMLFQRILKYLFFISNSAILLLNYIDIEYFKFTSKRSTADLFNMISTGDDTFDLIPRFIKDFWYVLLTWFVTLLIIIVFYPKYKKVKLLNFHLTIKNYIYQSLISLLIICFLALSIRGIGFRPTNIISASRYTNTQNIPLILNTPFTILKTFYKDDLQPKLYFPEEQLQQIYIPIYQSNNLNRKTDNVVIIILESFSKEYVGFYNGMQGTDSSFTPFLDSLIEKSLHFRYSFSNGKKSMEALPAIIAGIPSLMDNPYITSRYSSNNINTIASILNKYNYQTSFYHGGKNGTMGFDNFANIASIQKYCGKKQYPDKNDFDGNWGIFDEPYLLYYADELNNTKSPFFSCVFTLSSHHPYSVPAKYQNKFREGKYSILKSISYTDYSLRQFFEKIKNMSWYNNTLFILTADHTSISTDKFYTNKLGTYSVPIIFYHPTDTSIHGYRNSIVQQCDIFPSIIDYLGITDSIVCFGSSIFEKNESQFSINYINGIFQLIHKNYLVQFNGYNIISIHDFKTDSLLKNNLLINDQINPTEIIPLKFEMKAIIQQYNKRLIKNKLIIERQ
ncbi:MAG: LTA synthase family protein [Bacteroidota bacterium]